MSSWLHVRLAFTRFHCDLIPRAGAARWQAAAFQLGGIMTVVGLLVMLMTAYKTFGAAELLGQVH